MFMRTEKSALVVCRSEISSLYYRGYRISDGATIDLYDVYPQPGGFVADNAPEHARYVIGSTGFQLLLNGDIVSSESAVEVGP
jgi:serine/threonine-protein kinase